ncbi:type II toxin-antitoxin system PemK/MazF family toxin [Nocardioides sp.]|uniref:type II toxin-antitoxin system PemK/MazF family toxin n=1 Tax=Nocardioides sp. TaxID=35761 RepID=UPI000C919923|nr:hypothetical protein [Pimelobacter sp.]
MAPTSRTAHLVRRVGSALVRAAGKRPVRRAPAGPQRDPARAAYRGDFTGRATIAYAPQADGDADPGEVVWAWVPYEEDHTQGKDRPVLVIGREGRDLLGLMLTSKDRTSPARRQGPQERPRWHDLGTGEWDRQRRPSEVRLDRVLRLAPDAVRREGAALDRARFDQVAAAVRETLGW